LKSQKNVNASLIINKESTLGVVSSHLLIFSELQLAENVLLFLHFMPIPLRISSDFSFVSILTLDYSRSKPKTNCDTTLWISQDFTFSILSYISPSAFQSKFSTSFVTFSLSRSFSYLLEEQDCLPILFFHSLVSFPC